MKALAILRHVFLLLLVPALIAGVSLYVYLQGGRYVSTDNAYVKHDIIAISSEISGRVIEVIPRDNDRVSKGQLLFRIDDEPYRIALAKAEANLANVRASIEGEKADILNSQLDISKAEDDVEFRRKEMERIRHLVETRSIPAAQFDQAEYAWRSTANELEARQQELQVAKARLIDPAMPTEQHPRFLQAVAELDKIRLDISKLEIRAPVDGIAANVSVHEGEYVMAGAQLFSLVDDSHIWLEANFKETDLTWMRPGQPVSVTIDTYPDQEWQAQVDGITPATGAEFSLLPAQNSSGNWIKVVQRIKVNITLEDYDGELPLSAGMSAVVNIDTGRSRTLPWVAQN
ncbi:MAG: HlyD family secretion protein [Pseudomonadota bacterium]